MPSDAALPQDPATLDQLRVLLAVVEAGSLSAAARRLRRAQSAVSYAISAIEQQLGVPLLARGARRVSLTPAGVEVLAQAQAICARADALRALAATLRAEAEPAVGLAVDVMYPTRALSCALQGFAARWPAVQLRLHTDALGAVSALVRRGACVIGVVGPHVDVRDLQVEHLCAVRMLSVAAPHHPLAAVPGPLRPAELAEAVQIVLSERQADEPTPDQAVLSSRTWRVHDLQTKRALLLAGLGWGNMPEHAIDEDLAAGRLCALRPAAWPSDGVPLHLALATHPDRPPGPAARWLADRLREGLSHHQS